MSKPSLSPIHPVIENTKHLIELIAKHMPAALFCKDYSSGVGKFVLWNTAAEKLWGLRSARVVGRTDYELFPKDQADYFKEKDLQVIQSNQPLYIESERVDSPVIGQRTVRTWKIPVKLGDDHLPFLLGISWDITPALPLKKKRSDSK